MGFEVVERGAWRPAAALKEGECSVGSGGRVLFLASDLELLEIRTWAVLLADPASLRLAFRKPRSGEEAIAMAVVPAHKSGKDDGRRYVNAGRAIKRLGLELCAAAGRHELTSKDDLLIVNLIAVGKGDGKA